MKLINDITVPIWEYLFFEKRVIMNKLNTYLIDRNTHSFVKYNFRVPILLCNEESEPMQNGKIGQAYNFRINRKEYTITFDVIIDDEYSSVIDHFKFYFDYDNRKSIIKEIYVDAIVKQEKKVEKNTEEVELEVIGSFKGVLSTSADYNEKLSQIVIKSLNEDLLNSKNISFRGILTLYDNEKSEYYRTTNIKLKNIKFDNVENILYYDIEHNITKDLNKYKFVDIEIVMIIDYITTYNFYTDLTMLKFLQLYNGERFNIIKFTIANGSCTRSTFTSTTTPMSEEMIRRIVDNYNKNINCKEYTYNHIHYWFDYEKCES